MRVWEGDVGSLTPELLSGRTGVDVVLRTDVSVCVVCKHDGVCGKYSILIVLSLYLHHIVALSVLILLLSLCVCTTSKLYTCLSQRSVTKMESSHLCPSSLSPAQPEACPCAQCGRLGNFGGEGGWDRGRVGPHQRCTDAPRMRLVPQLWI